MGELINTLNFIANLTGINVTYDRDVMDRPITLKLDDVTLEQALNQIMTMNRLSYKVLNEKSIFVFPDERPRAFWMKHTRIPLDIIYVDAFGKVVHVAQMKPLDETGTPSGWPAKYAIELNEGTAKRLNVVPGNILRIPTDARHTTQ